MITDEEIALLEHIVKQKITIEGLSHFMEVNVMQMGSLIERLRAAEKLLAEIPGWVGGEWADRVRIGKQS